MDRDDGIRTESMESLAEGDFWKGENTVKVISDQYYINVHSEDNPPAAHASDGEIVIFETRDCYNRTVQTEEKTLEEQVGDEPDNPATGPLYVDGAEPGDAIAVDILDIRVADHGVVAIGCGPFRDKEKKEPFRILPVQNGKVLFQGVEWEIDPMVGVVGTAMPGQKIDTIRAFEGGGNMDSRIIRKGATVWLPVRVPGALLVMGDIHASMGDGEVCGTGLEIDGEITVRVRLCKNAGLNWPVTETKDAWYVNSCGNTCDEAIRAGYLEMQRLLARAYGWSLEDAAFYMTLRGYLESNQACLVPRDTFRVGTPKVDGMPRLVG